MKNIMVSIFVYIALARSSDSSTNTTESDSDYKSSSDSNSAVTPIVPSNEHPCLSNEPVEVTLQNVLDSINGCIDKIKKFKRRAVFYLDKHVERSKDLSYEKENLERIEKEMHLSVNNNNPANNLLSEQKKRFDKLETSFHNSQDNFESYLFLIEAEGRKIRNLIEKAQEKFPSESQEGLKQFEEITEYIIARDDLPPSFIDC